MDKAKFASKVFAAIQNQPADYFSTDVNVSSEELNHSLMRAIDELFNQK
jgi:hypothetical protein